VPCARGAPKIRRSGHAVVSPTLFTILLLMAIATTFATKPVLDLLLAESRPASRAVAAVQGQLSY
jgi:hypothetical protein